MNKFIILFKRITKNFFPKDLPKPMGRWRIENNNTQINHKIDLSNEDHCGTCAEYALSKIELKKNQEIKKNNDNYRKIFKKK